MRRPRSPYLALVAALALSGCSYGDTVLDWATGTPAATNTGTPKANVAANPQPAVTPSAPAPQAAANGAASAPVPAGATLFGQKLPALRADVTQFEGNVARGQTDFTATRQSLGNNANSYASIVAGINSRLQAGTTEGNPELVGQWNQAQALLDQMNGGVSRLFSISNEAANDSSLGKYVLGELRAANGLRGATDADRDELRQLEARTNTALAQVDQLHTAVTGEIAYRNNYLSGERNNLTALALAIQNGRVPGPAVAGRPTAAAVAVAAAPSAAGARAAAPRAAAPAPSRSSATPAAASASERPLVVIHFDKPDVDYEQPLYTAVSGALKRKPGATFTIQAVAPKASSAAEVASNSNASRENATKVLRSLTAMGMPADRMSLSATMSPDVQSGEVRVFVR